MTQAVDVVVFATAPMLLLFAILATLFRRHGALLWLGAYLATWLAGVGDSLGGAFVGPGLGFGLLTSVLFYAGARQYRGRPLSRAGVVALCVLPVGLAIATVLGGSALGYGLLAALDPVLLGLAAWNTFESSFFGTLAMTRLLPWGFVALVPVDLYYQLSHRLGLGTDVPTLAMATALVSLASIILLTIVSIQTRDETIRRERLEARLAAQRDELRESEEKVRSAERLAAVGTLAAGFAHQINNPIGGILAAAQFARAEETAGGDPAERVSALQTIEQEALRCARIVRNLLLFARTSAQDFVLQDLNGIVASAHAATAAYAARRGASVELRLDEAPLPVLGNDVELEEVVVNLIRNGLEVRALGASVRVETARADSSAVCVVRDDGPGLDAEARKRLFEPFFTTKLREGGTGLGLSVAHGIAQSHAGRIELVEPETGDEGGACFRLVLPLARSDP